jgi:predicted transcriptional regulator
MLYGSYTIFCRRRPTFVRDADRLKSGDFRAFPAHLDFAILGGIAAAERGELLYHEDVVKRINRLFDP